MRIELSRELPKRFLWVAGAAVLPLALVGCGLVTGWEMVTATTPINNENVKTMVAICPAGKKLLGGGGGPQSISTSKAIAITFSGPPESGPDNSWFVRASEVQPDAFTQWRLTATAICAKVTP